VHALVVDVLTFANQKNMQTPVAETRLFARQRNQTLA
jgi:hypothetical protein